MLGWFLPRPKFLLVLIKGIIIVTKSMIGGRCVEKYHRTFFVGLQFLPLASIKTTEDMILWIRDGIICKTALSQLLRKV